MRRVLVWLIVALVWPSFALAAGTEQTKNTVPSATFSFLTDLQNFLKREDAMRFADQLNGFVVSGGTHGTVAGLTGTPAALTAYPGGYLATESGSIVYSNNATCWVVAHKDLTGNLTTFTRVAGTHYLTDCVSGATQPAAPANSTYLMKVTTAAGAVTAVVDLRNRVSFAQTVTTASLLPTAGTRGRFAFVTDVSGYYFDTGTVWVAVAGEVLESKSFGCVADGVADDTTCLQNLFNAAQTDALGAAGTPNANGGSTVVVGRSVHLSRGIYRTTATLTGKPYITVYGDGRWSTIIRLDTAVAANVSVITCTDCGWIHVSDLAIETSGTANTGQHGLSLIRTTTFGVKFTLARLNFYKTYDAIRIDGNTTGSSMRDLYIRSPASTCIHVLTGSASTTEFDTIYCSASGSHGIHVESGCGNCTFTGIITEATVGDGMRLVNVQRSTITSPYLGDLVQGNGLYLRDSANNTILDAFSTKGTTSLSHFVLDGSYGNTFLRPRVESCARYVVEWLNTTGTSADTVLRPNTFEGLVQDGYCDLGYSNDETWIEGKHVVRAPSASWISSPTASNLIPWYEDQTRVNAWHWRTPANVAATQYATAFAPPVGDEHVSFLDGWGGASSTYPGGGIRPYSIMGRSATNLIGVLPAVETLGAALITGDSSTCTAGVGSWAAPAAGATFTSVAGGQAGNGCQYEVTASGGGQNQTSLSVATVAGKMYKVTFYGKLVTSAGDSNPRLWLRITDSGSIDILNDTQFIKPQTGFLLYTTYFVADDSTSILKLLNLAPVIGVKWIVDTFTMNEVTSDGALCLSGGRRDTTDVGGGGYVCLYGDAHASKPSRVEAVSATQINLTATGVVNLSSAADVSVVEARITAGTGTGVTVNKTGGLRQQVYKVTVLSTNVITNGVTHDLTVATLPAKTQVVSALADVTTTFACTAVCTTATLSATLGVTAGGTQLLASFDLDAATALFGDADAEVGASLNAAGFTNGGYIPTWGGTTPVTLRFTSGTGNLGNGTVTNLSQGSVTVYLTTVVYP